METIEPTALGEKILKHWREHRPQMVAELEKTNRLEEAVREAQEQTSDLIYELVLVKHVDYQTAWEMATRDLAFLPEETRRPRRRPSKSNSGKSSRSSKRRRAPRRGTSG
jgi:hypothetical protein